MGRKPKKPCPLLENYTRTKNIDTVRFLKFSREIQGRRSQKEFALACGYSTSGISQLLNGKLKIEPEFAQAIWDSRNSDCPVTEEEYLDALGLLSTKGEIWRITLFKLLTLLVIFCKMLCLVTSILCWTRK